MVGFGRPTCSLCRSAGWPQTGKYLEIKRGGPPASATIFSFDNIPFPFTVFHSHPYHFWGRHLLDCTRRYYAEWLPNKIRKHSISIGRKRCMESMCTECRIRTASTLGHVLRDIYYACICHLSFMNFSFITLKSVLLFLEQHRDALIMKTAENSVVLARSRWPDQAEQT